MTGAQFKSQCRKVAHRFFAALIIAALPEADKTRFFMPLISLLDVSPNAFAAARTPRLSLWRRSSHLTPKRIRDAAL
jgi:hypothetical protein